MNPDSLRNIATPAGHAARPDRLGWVVALAVLLLVGVELALQVRSHIRNGQSVLTVMAGESKYVEREDLGIKTLRPGMRFAGTSVTIETNSLGLRSPEIPPDRVPGSFRVAVVGASSVMGEMAATNEATFPYLLERKLRANYPGRRIDVMNAGVSGLRLKDQKRMVERVVLPYAPDVIVLYSGFNDFADYCRDEDEALVARDGLPLVAVPSWVLSTNAIKRHATYFTPPTPESGTRKAADIDVAPYRHTLQEIVALARSRDIALVFATNAKSWGRAQDPDEQRQLAGDALRFTPCFDLAEVLELHDLHNALIREVGDANGVAVIDLAEMLPAGRAFFVDATHFTPAGEERVAGHLHDFLIERGLVTFTER